MRQAGGQWSDANWILGFSATANSTARFSKKSDTTSFNEKESTYQKDSTKPDGEACNNDGTLKDASELEWLHSPTQPNTDETEGVWDYWNVDNSQTQRGSSVSNLLLE